MVSNAPLFHFLNVMLPFTVLSAILYKDTTNPKNLIAIFLYSIVLVFFYTLLFWLQGLSGVLGNVIALLAMVGLIASLCAVFWTMYNTGDTGVITSSRVMQFGMYLLGAFTVASITAWTMEGLSFVWKGLEYILRFWVVPMVLFTGASFVVTKYLWTSNGINHDYYSSVGWFFMEMSRVWIGYGLVSQYMLVTAPDN